MSSARLGTSAGAYRVHKTQMPLKLVEFPGLHDGQRLAPLPCLPSVENPTIRVVHIVILANGLAIVM